MGLKFLMIVSLFHGVMGNPEAAAEPKAAPSPSPTPAAGAEPTPGAKVSTDSKAQILPPHNIPFAITPIPPFAHSPIYGTIFHSTPFPRLPPPHGKLHLPPPPPNHVSTHEVSFVEIHPHKNPLPLGPLHGVTPFVPHPGKIIPYCKDPKPPLCSFNTSKPWCFKDLDYPAYEIASAIQLHKVAVISLYADVADLSTENSVIRPRDLYDEAYLCPSATTYVRPLRAVNTKGQWRIIVNNIKVNYDLFTQTTRMEECITNGKTCPLVPICYDSKCLQKSTYHRFLVFDPCDPHFPFSIETFRMPASCACVIGEVRLSY